MKPHLGDQPSLTPARPIPSPGTTLLAEQEPRRNSCCLTLRGKSTDNKAQSFATCTVWGTASCFLATHQRSPSLVAWVHGRVRALLLLRGWTHHLPLPARPQCSIPPSVLQPSPSPGLPPQLPLQSGGFCSCRACTAEQPQKSFCCCTRPQLSANVQHYCIGRWSRQRRTQPCLIQ